MVDVIVKPVEIWDYFWSNFCDLKSKMHLVAENPETFSEIYLTEIDGKPSLYYYENGTLSSTTKGLLKNEVHDKFMDWIEAYLEDEETQETEEQETEDELPDEPEEDGFWFSNYENLLTMSAEEIADILLSVYTEGYHDAEDHEPPKSFTDFIDWLEEAVDEI